MEMKFRGSAIANVQDLIKQTEKEPVADQVGPIITLSQSSIVRGGFIGAILTSIIGFNAGKYSRLGLLRKRMNLARKFILPNKKPYFLPITNYHIPKLATVTKNIHCYSGEPGIGKSRHFKNIVYNQSLMRPSLYLPFKASGTNNTFQQDMGTKLNYEMGDNPSILTEIITAVRKVNEINEKPHRVWLNILFTNISLISLAYYIHVKEVTLGATQDMLYGALATSYVYYLYMMYPFMIQARRRTKVLVVFDDLNKIEELGKLSEISRFLQLHQENMGNVILITSDEQTWFKLRKQPGLKDRLRQKTITYNSKQTAKNLLTQIDTAPKFAHFAKHNRVNPLFTRELVSLLIEDLIGRREATLRRFMSILVLNDQERYEEFVRVLEDCAHGVVSNQKAVGQIATILLNSEKQTICAKLKHTQRKIKISQKEFIAEMKLLLEKGKLLSDSKIGPSLMVYNILRDSQSEYVFNGRFMYNVFLMAYEEYLKDLAEFYRKPVSKSTEKLKAIQFNPELASRKQATTDNKV